MKNKQIIIVWRWTGLDAKTNPFDQIPIDGDHRYLHRIIETISQKDLVGWLSDWIKSEDVASYKFLVHKGGYDLIKHIEGFKSINSEISITSFGNGKDFIYFRHNPGLDGKQIGSGLIDQTGFMAYEKEKRNLKGKFERPIMTNQEGKLVHNYFDEVWEHYSNQHLKCAIYENHLLLLRKSLYLLHQSRLSKSAQWDENDPLLLKSVELLNTPDLASISERDLILNFFKSPFHSESDIRNLKTNFTKLLNRFPGPIY